MFIKRYFNRLLVLGTASLLCGGILSAQEASRFAFSAGVGFTQPVGNAGRYLDTGWNLTGGAGMNFNRQFSTMLEVGYTHLGINESSLASAGFPGGGLNVFSATVDPVYRMNAGHRVEGYVIGGGGLYHVTREFTQPSAATFTNYNPFFGFYNVIVPTTQILDSYTINKPGLNVGAGFTVGTRGRGKFFAEARYNRIFTGNDRHIDYVPVSFGFRW
ncbi:MAG: hypothetical protein JWN34_2242 [Bryobacterales bacterium]|jgi:hypothetical protein|nr:hypothetical protein [Bryobacterales bacterium]